MAWDYRVEHDVSTTSFYWTLDENGDPFFWTPGEDDEEVLNMLILAWFDAWDHSLKEDIW